MNTAPSVVLSALLAAPAIADVLVVAPVAGSGVDHTQIHAAIAAASDGDSLLVKGGTYDSFILHNRALVIVAERGETVKVAGGFSVRGLTEEQSVVIRGLEVSSPNESGLGLKNNQGPVWIEDCVLAGGLGDNTFSSTSQADSYPAVEIVGCSEVVFARCTLNGGAGLDLWEETFHFAAGSGGHALDIDVGSVSVFDSTLTGGHGGSVYDTTETPGGSGGSGIYVDSGSVLISGCTLTGGSGGFGDCSLFFCGNGGNGGDGVLLSFVAGAEVRHQDCSFSPGNAGWGGGSGGFPGDPGEAIDVNAGSATALAGSAHTMTSSSPVREGESAQLDFGGEPGEIVLAAISTTQDHLALDPFAGDLVLGAPQILLTMGVVPATGSLSASVPIGAAPSPFVLARNILLQSVHIDSALSVWLGHASALTLLDDSL